MGNRHGNLSHRSKNPVNIRESKADDETSTQHLGDHLPSNTIPDENIYVTERSVNSTNVSLQESENASIVNVSSGSTTDLSVRGVQHIIRESANNIVIKDSNSIHVGDNINCYGAVSFVNSSQSNVQITNQQFTPMVHDFGELHFFSLIPINIPNTKEKHINVR